MKNIFFVICIFLSSNFLVAMYDRNIEEDRIVKTVNMRARLTKTKMITYKSGKIVEDIWEMSPIQMTDHNGNQIYPDKHKETIIQYPDDGINNNGEKEIITYHENESFTMQKFDKFGNLIE